MNRSALNSTVLGSGSTLPFVTAAALQAFRLVGTYAGGVVKYGHAACGLALSGAVSAKRRVFDSAAASLALLSAAVSRTITKTYGAALRVLMLNPSVTTKRRTFGADSEHLSLIGTVTTRTLVAVHASAAQALYLRGSAEGMDLTTTSATTGRTSSAVVLTSETLPVVLFGE